MQKHIQHNKDERISVLSKNIPLTLFERVRKGYERYYLWEVSWRLNRSATYWSPNSSGYGSISFPFSWAAQPGAWRPSLCWDMVLIPASSLQLIWTSCCRVYNNNLTPTYFLRASHLYSIQPTHRQSRLSPDLLISLTGCTCYLHRCISHLTAQPGRRSICYRFTNRVSDFRLFKIFDMLVPVFCLTNERIIFVFQEALLKWTYKFINFIGKSNNQHHKKKH